MARFIARRLALSVITLWLLATIVFVIANVLPNDVGRTILGPFAPQESVDALNHKLGTDRPILVRYVDAMRGLVTLDFGTSFVSGSPVQTGTSDGNGPIAFSRMNVIVYVTSKADRWAVTFRSQAPAPK